MSNNDEPIIIEQTYNASLDNVWNAITEIDQMQQWFFPNIPSFKPEVGFETRFNVQSEGRNFLHMWKVTEVVPYEILTYDWKYQDYPGDSYVVFELLPQDKLLKLRLSVHIRVNFPDDIPEFTRESCFEGWTYFICNRLKSYLEKNME